MSSRSLERCAAAVLSLSDDLATDADSTSQGISQVEFAKEVSDLAWLNLPPWLINALRRGVGVHHAGMNRVSLPRSLSPLLADPMRFLRGTERS